MQFGQSVCSIEHRNAIYDDILNIEDDDFIYSNSLTHTKIVIGEIHAPYKW